MYSTQTCMTVRTMNVRQCLIIVSSYICYSESLDSYTCRVSASVLSNNSFINGHINTSQWLKQVIRCNNVHV